MTRRLLTVAVALVWCAAPAASHAADSRLDSILRDRVNAPQGMSRVIVRTRSGGPADALLRSVAGARGRHLRSIGGDVVELPDWALASIASDPSVLAVSADRPVRATAIALPETAALAGVRRRASPSRWGVGAPLEMARTTATIGSRWVREALNLDGTGIGIAMVDSGITAWHDDLTGPGGAGQRVARFVDFVNHRAAPYDDYGHGTHVAGILAGNGYDSRGADAGVAPGATLVSLKVLDASGDGRISDVIAAIDYAIEHRAEFNIRVMNLSVAATPTESYMTDPLTVAAKRAVEAGIVVVTAAGNLGRDRTGAPIYGGITAPANAPWVITVGASDHHGTPERDDDTVAAFSSRGPTRFDRLAKPDLVAPGVGIESLAEAGSTLYEARPLMREWGAVDTAFPPYFTMSGTSMAAPIVSGTIALMLQANPTLTPVAVKLILERTAEARPGWDVLTQGAGFVDARAAVEMARQRTARVGPGTGALR